MESFNILSLVLERSLLAQIVFSTLTAGIVYSLYWLTTSLLQYLLIRKYHAHVLTEFSKREDISSFVDKLNQEKLPMSAVRFGAGSTLRLLFDEINTEQKITGQNLERRFRLTNQVNIAQQVKFTQKNLPIVSLIASISPYIGLLGTVWGIITSFTGLAQVEQISLIAIAPGIAEALMATLIGLLGFLVATSSVRMMASKFDAIFDDMVWFEDALVLELLRVSESQYKGLHVMVQSEAEQTASKRKQSSHA